jgi:hypothetical protein
MSFGLWPQFRPDDVFVLRPVSWKRVEPGMNLTMKIRFETGMNRPPFVGTARISGVPGLETSFI